MKHLLGTTITVDDAVAMIEDEYSNEPAERKRKLSSQGIDYTTFIESLCSDVPKSGFAKNCHVLKLL